jgi:hypothetical protein
VSEWITGGFEPLSETEDLRGRIISWNDLEKATGWTPETFAEPEGTMSPTSEDAAPEAPHMPDEDELKDLFRAEDMTVEQYAEWVMSPLKVEPPETENQFWDDNAYEPGDSRINLKAVPNIFEGIDSKPIHWLVRSGSRRADQHGWASYGSTGKARAELYTDGPGRPSITLFDDGTWRHGIH